MPATGQGAWWRGSGRQEIARRGEFNATIHHLADWVIWVLLSAHLAQVRSMQELDGVGRKLEEVHRI